MSFCASCGARLDPDDRFCAKCGAARKESDPSEPSDSRERASPPPSSEAPRPSVRERFRQSPGKLLFAAIGGPLVWVVLILYAFGSDGCSSSEGSFTSTGKPLGDFTITPARCGSGQHEAFHGVYLVGESASDGGLKLILDPKGGDQVRVEVPGSCRGTSAGEDACTVIPIERSQCTTFDVAVRRSSTQVNDIWLVDGHLRLDCAFEEGGTAKADVKFTSCD